MMSNILHEIKNSAFHLCASNSPMLCKVVDATGKLAMALADFKSLFFALQA